MKIFQTKQKTCIGLLAACILFPVAVHSQNTLSGVVMSALTGERIQGASVSIENSFVAVVTDPAGNFTIRDLKSETVKIRVTHISFNDYTEEIRLPAAPLSIRLSSKIVLADEVNIVATRAGDHSAVAYANIQKEELEEQNLGQDLPYLLSFTPSVVVTSDAGAGVGYTGIRIRGSDATRINVTINGIPVNDAESHQVYWVDLPDFASSADNVQIQRGIGTSTNGAGAFGGSVNIQTSKVAADPFSSIHSSFGSFNTFKNTIEFGTGLVNQSFSLEGRLSKITSDGYIDRASSDLKSFYLSGGYYGSNSSLRAVIFSGKEKTYQAWYGVPQDSLSTNRTYNPAGQYPDANGGVHYYNEQADNYRQDYYQFLYSRSISPRLNLNAALHYTKGKGYYQEYQPSDSLSYYGIPDPVSGNDTIRTTDLIRQRWLDNDFYGFTFSTNYEKNKFQFTLGGAGNRYTGKHYDEITWMEKNFGIPDPYRYSDNNATKNDFNIFTKIGYDLTPHLNILADLQYRTISYAFPGFDNDLNPAGQEVKLNFFNPKASVNYQINSTNKMYASVAIGHKEPMREDYTGYSSQHRPLPEEMMDAEAGYLFTKSDYRFAANFYFMNYNHQLVLTGKINDIGEYPRQNVDRSYRSGVELEFGWNILKNLRVKANLTLSENKIKWFDEYIDSTDDSRAYPQVSIRHSNTDISFSPSVISAGIISYSPVKNFTVDFTSKFVGKQYLDNTSNEHKMLADYLLNDVHLLYKFNVKKIKEMELKILLNNVFNRMYESNGYTYSYYYDGNLYSQNYYFPQAGFNFLAGISVKF